MTDPKSSTPGLISSNVGFDPYEGAPVVRARYFIAANYIRVDGKHSLAVLSEYFHTMPAAQRALDDLHDEYPQAAILWTFSTFDPDHEGQRAELAEIDAAIASERSGEGVQ